MNLVEKLLAVDKGVIEKEQIKEIPSRMLAKLLGEEKTVNITIKALSGDEFTSLSLSGTDEEGNVIMDQAFSTNAKIAAAALVNPNVKDKDLLEHLGVATPADAVKKIFKGEVNNIASEVAELSGFGDPNEEEVKKVKN